MSFMYHGLEVIIADDCYRQKVELSPTAPVSAEFRAEMNRWLKDRFGVEKRRYRIDGRLYVSLEDFTLLQAELQSSIRQSGISPSS